MIYADFESMLVLENDGKQNPENSYAINIKIMLVVVLVIKLVCQ